VAEEYGSTEFDIIAFECMQGHRHEVNPWLILEDRYDNVLITDVSRITQKLIRYDLGDSITLRKTHCNVMRNQKILEELHGRTIDIFFLVNAIRKIHVISIALLLDRYFIENNDIFSFQIVQKFYGELEITIDSAPVEGLEHFKAFLKSKISRAANADVKIYISIQKELPQSNKRNYFVQNMSVNE
jgi:phenylacetate-CoA ligase